MSEPLVGPTSHSYISQRLRLHYVDWGNPDAPPLLLVHGGRDHCRNWDWVAEALRHDYHIIAPDLRGHGDSEWMLGGGYVLPDFIYDIAQLVHQNELAPVNIVSHSLGGIISLAFTGLFPEKVRRVVAIEGLGLSPKREASLKEQASHERMQTWVEELRANSARQPRRYPSLREAWERMQEANPHLTPEQARHLTVHGVNRNEDGTYSWKFDNYTRVNAPHGLSPSRIRELWGRIDCPTLLVRGSESWASDPAIDGRLELFNSAHSVNIDAAGHWVHHDQLDEFLGHVRSFLK